MEINITLSENDINCIADYLTLNTNNIDNLLTRILIQGENQIENLQQPDPFVPAKDSFNTWSTLKNTARLIGRI